ncbi:hypothetical protein RQP50_06110 [Paenibacillus sp. chi10]|uniref:Uncharacterized protein n=1 Tax=Paenibacillus suaedae TaxID=3077233 RepID=A0AAJ2JT71_9BACL|nr:hypothetical protein [Paenibacillus sp. chi10]MDT8975812.1 hypothetical protein [Paenibacillus sp. chi10]
MTKKITVLCLVTALCFVSVASVSAAGKDPDAETVAYIDYVIGNQKKVKGKSYARTTNSNMKKINVFGTFYEGSTQKEQGTNSTTTSGNETAWYTGEYSATGSYKLNTLSRTYYKDGTESDQSSASDSW